MPCCAGLGLSRRLELVIDPLHGIVKGLQSAWLVVHFVALPASFHSKWDLGMIAVGIGSVAVYVLDCLRHEDEPILYGDWVLTTITAILINSGSRLRLQVLEYFEQYKGMQCRHE